MLPEGSANALIESRDTSEKSTRAEEESVAWRCRSSNLSGDGVVGVLVEPVTPGWVEGSLLVLPDKKGSKETRKLASDIASIRHNKEGSRKLRRDDRGSWPRCVRSTTSSAVSLT